MMLDEKNPVILANMFADQLECIETLMLLVQSIVVYLRASKATEEQKTKNTIYFLFFFPHAI